MIAGTILKRRSGVVRASTVAFSDGIAREITTTHASTLIG